MSAVRIDAPVIVRWTGEAGDDARRAVEAAVTAGVRRALGAPADEHPASGAREYRPGGPVPGDPLWTLPSYDAGGDLVALPVRQPRGDMLIRSQFPPRPVIRLSAADWIWTGGDLHVTTPSLARAVRWGGRSTARTASPSSNGSATTTPTASS